MPTKSKVRKREERLDDEGWFSLTRDLWRARGEVLPKLKLVADVNFPIPLVRLMRRRNISVKTAQDLRYGKLDDHELLRKVISSRCELITLDKDFWSDRKFPLHQWGGVIYIDSAASNFADTVGFDLLTAFLVSFGGGWDGPKIKASADKLHMKLISVQGDKVVYEIKTHHGGVYARQAEDVWG